MIYFLWFQVETTSVKKRDIRFIAGKDDYTKSLSVIKTPSIFVQWIEINSHFLTDAIVRNSMTFNLIQSINLQRPFLGMESLTKTMGSLRFGQWHRRPFYKEFLSKDRIQLGFLQKFDKLWFGGKLRRLHPLPRHTDNVGHVSTEKNLFCKKGFFFGKKRPIKIRKKKRLGKEM